MGTWPLTDIDGHQLEDGDLVQLIWTGPDTLIDSLDELTGMPTGDDSLLATWGVGLGYEEEGTGLFKYETYTFEAEPRVAWPARGDVIYFRVFNDSVFEKASHYGESETYTVVFQEGEAFLTFSDDANDAIIPNPGFTAVEEWISSGVSLLTEYALFQNYPNPFNASTEIRYQTPEDGYVSLKVFNTLGQGVRSLLDVDQEAGEYAVVWDGRDDIGRDVASGVYFCRLRAGEFCKTVKMVHLK